MNLSRSFPRNILLRLTVLLAVAAILSGCGDQDGAPAGPQTSPGQEDRIEALVHGPLDSPFLETFKRTMNLTPYDGSQEVHDYSLLILDGDAHTPSDLKADTLLTEAWHARVGIIVVDAAEDDKRQGLGNRLGITSRGVSDGFFARSGQDATGHPIVSIVDVPIEAPAVKAASRSRLVSEEVAVSASAQNAEAFVETVSERLDALTIKPQNSSIVTQNTPAIPAGLIMKTYYYSFPTTQHLSGVNKNNDPVKTQTTSIQYNYTFNVYLDNENNPQGNFQWVSIDIDATGNPTNGTNQFACNGCYAGFDSNYNPDEYAWFLDQQEVAIKPADADNALFTSFDSSPETTNNETEVTTSLGFEIGFEGSQGVGSFSYSNEQTRTIQDWKLTNESAGNAFSWYYRSSNPLDADLPYDCADNSGCQNPVWTALGWPKKPNDISLTQLQLHTQGAWKTSSVLNQWVTFVATGRHGLADLWCPKDLAAFGCGYEDFDQSSRYDVEISKELQINMASVVPIPIQSIAFSSDPASAGDTVTGIIELQSPAQEDTVIQLTSDIPNAVPDDTVTVKQGQTAANFEILTKPDGIAPGSKVTAIITAFYSQTYRNKLTLTN